MKKLLSLLGAASLTATGASSVVACGGPLTKTQTQILNSIINFIENKENFKSDNISAQEIINETKQKFENENENLYINQKDAIPEMSSLLVLIDLEENIDSKLTFNLELITPDLISIFNNEPKWNEMGTKEKATLDLNTVVDPEVPNPDPQPEPENPGTENEKDLEANIPNTDLGHFSKYPSRSDIIIRTAQLNPKAPLNNGGFDVDYRGWDDGSGKDTATIYPTQNSHVGLTGKVTLHFTYTVTV
ncbi:lipoprotein [Spiroplasma culicicola]|uniref:Lipoprotein n=1 Tax=Spiroplasma culicicola AES-1 TaxID=1276246 RepID=W6A6A7_9MOLU|nr:lipoprotein [Spiroplasma culicicola]AHI52653.1 hypothetical protein SCULI_v1c03120 [Spiroplasma culicicola AES-1]